MLRGCPDFWDTPCCIFAADNFMVELKNKSWWWNSNLPFCAIRKKPKWNRRRDSDRQKKSVLSLCTSSLFAPSAVWHLIQPQFPDIRPFILIMWLLYTHTCRMRTTFVVRRWKCSWFYRLFCYNLKVLRADVRIPYAHVAQQDRALAS